MPRIKASVGRDGVNAPADTKIVQKLLNVHLRVPYRPVKESGKIDAATIDAIERFQKEVVGMGRPDGRVDAGGKTITQLNKSPPKEAPEGGEDSGGGKGKVDPKARKAFVDSRVTETSVTRKIIDKLVSRFEGVDARVISGYLDDAGQFWKVNYHWDYLTWMIEHSIELDIEEKYKKNLRAILAVLNRNKPNPVRGYRTGSVGKPQDKSTVEQIRARHKLVAQSKRDFKQVIKAASLVEKSTRKKKAFDLSVAPVAAPGTSMHSTGYALDITGNNAQIKRICKEAGATLVFDEASHVHVEFARGAK